jgi:hypothetical protein
MGTFGEQVAPFDLDAALGALALFFFLLLFHRQEHLHIHHLVKMSDHTIEFMRHVVPQGGGDFQVMSADREIHACLLDVMGYLAFHHAPVPAKNQLV